MTWVATSVFFGAVYCVVFTIVTFIGGAAARDFGVHAYPPAIRARYGKKSARGERTTRVVAAFIFATIIATLSALFVTLRADGPLSAPAAFAAALTALMTFNVYDLIVLDGLVFVVWRPSFIVLPGTEGMPEHVRGFVKGIVIVTMLAAMATGVYVVVDMLLIGTEHGP